MIIYFYIIVCAFLRKILYITLISCMLNILKIYIIKIKKKERKSTRKYVIDYVVLRRINEKCYKDLVEKLQVK
jgi:hypothetical protein